MFDLLLWYLRNSTNIVFKNCAFAGLVCLVLHSNKVKFVQIYVGMTLQTRVLL